MCVACGSPTWNCPDALATIMLAIVHAAGSVPQATKRGSSANFAPGGAAHQGSGPWNGREKRRHSMG